jgi:hypothetical protein
LRVHLIHGIHSGRGGATAALRPYFERAGFECAVYDYGWATGIFSRFKNNTRARTIARQVRPDDILLGHSNGGTLAYMVEEIVPVAGMILIHPALDEDVSFPRAQWVDVYHCEKDHVVEASEALGLFDGFGVFGFLKHPYGRLGNCGYRGPDRHVASIDDERLTIDLAQIGERLPPVTGHGTMFEPTHIDAWGAYYARRALYRTAQLREQDIVG